MTNTRNLTVQELSKNMFIMHKKRGWMDGFLDERYQELRNRMRD